MKKVANISKMTREEWLNLRTKGIGGSDAAAACGLSPWKSQAQLFFEKTGQVEKDRADSENLRQGRDFEDYVAKRFEEETGKKVRRDNYMMCDKDYPYLLADIDRRVVGENSILECKTASPFAKDGRADGQIPLQYELQCHHYMMVTNADKCYIACLIFGTDFIVREILRDEDTIDMLKAKEVEFRTEFVEKGEVPLPDGSSDYDDALRNRFKGGIDETKVLDVSAETYEDYKNRKELIKTLEQQNKEFEQGIKLQLEDNDFGATDFIKVSYKPYTTDRFDSKKFKADKPDMYKDYVKTTESRRFSIKEVVRDDV